MARMIFGNNASSTITSLLAPGALSFSVSPGTGSEFPAAGGGNFFIGTLIDTATGLLSEIVKVTTRSADTMTVQRGQEGTAVREWPPNTVFAEFWTAGQAAGMLQVGDEQSGSSTFAVATGPANHYVVALTPALTANTMGQSLRFKANIDNNGATDITFGTGVLPLLNAQGQALSGGEIKAGIVYETFFTGTSYNLALTAAATAQVPTGMIAPFAGGAVPTGWLACIGQLVPPSTFPALFGVLGTVYGGDGLANFGIPDLRGRVPAGLDAGQNRLTGATIDKLANGTAGNGSNVLGGNGGTQLTSMVFSGTTNDNVPAGNVFAGGGAGVATPDHNHPFATTAQNVLKVQPTIMTQYMIKT